MAGNIFKNFCDRMSSVTKKHDEGGADQQIQRAQWLRAAIMGASDGLLSTTSLMLGIGAAEEDRWSVILSGIAGAVAGACSMTVGEFVSVSTQRDIEKMNHHQNKESQLRNSKPNPSLNLSQDTHGANASTETRSPAVKIVMAEEDYKKIEREISELDEEKKILPNPFKAAVASGVAFLCGSSIPLLSALPIVDNKIRIAVMVVVTSISLALFGGLAARLGGSPVPISACRVTLGGWVAMAISYVLLKLFDRDDKGTHAH